MTGIPGQEVVQSEILQTTRLENTKIRVFPFVAFYRRITNEIIANKDESPSIGHYFARKYFCNNFSPSLGEILTKMLSKKPTKTRHQFSIIFVSIFTWLS